MIHKSLVEESESDFSPTGKLFQSWSWPDIRTFCSDKFERERGSACKSGTESGLLGILRLGYTFKVCSDCGSAESIDEVMYTMLPSRERSVKFGNTSEREIDVFSGLKTDKLCANR
jgi:hypothetical protein